MPHTPCPPTPSEDALRFLKPVGMIPEFTAGMRSKHSDSRQSNSSVKQGLKKEETESPEKFLLPNYDPVLQKVVIYETDTCFFIVGLNARRNRCRLLLLDRTKPNNLSIIDDGIDYTRNDLNRKLEGYHTTLGGIYRVAEAYGIVGFLKLVEGFYLQIIVECEQVATVGGKRIYESTMTKLIPLTPKRTRGYDDKYQSILQTYDATQSCYFSYSYDLTNTLQTNMERGGASVTQGETLQFDSNDMYIWNRHLIKNWINLLEPASVSRWILPLIQGFSKQCSIQVQGDRVLRIMLLARRSRHWAGTRYLRRGVNDEGFVANEVESELILELEDDTLCGGGRFSSVVFIRGSIPLYWHHYNLSLPKPDTRVLNEQGTEGTIKHFTRLIEAYGAPVIMLNLIKQTERRPIESPLGQALINTTHWMNKKLNHLNANRKSSSSAVATVAEEIFLDGFLEEKVTDKQDRLHRSMSPMILTPPSSSTTDTATAILSDVPIIYMEYDFINAKHRGDAVMDNLWEISNFSLSQTGFFYTKGFAKKNTPISGVKQSGILRVNCMDCLDRTNVSQFCYAREALRHQLKAVGLSVEEECFGGIWSLLLQIFGEHGDRMGLQYGGSEAMHKATTSTVEVTGKDGAKEQERKANITGGARNAFVAMKRYYHNNVTDVEKQQVLNLFHGLFIPESESSRQLWDTTDLMNNYQTSSKYNEKDEHIKCTRNILADEMQLKAENFNEKYDVSNFTSFSEVENITCNVKALNAILSLSEVPHLNFKQRSCDGLEELGSEDAFRKHSSDSCRSSVTSGDNSAASSNSSSIPNGDHNGRNIYADKLLENAGFLDSMMSVSPWLTDVLPTDTRDNNDYNNNNSNNNNNNNSKNIEFYLNYYSPLIRSRNTNHSQNKTVAAEKGGPATSRHRKRMLSIKEKSLGLFPAANTDPTSSNTKWNIINTKETSTSGTTDDVIIINQLTLFPEISETDSEIIATAPTTSSGSNDRKNGVSSSYDSSSPVLGRSRFASSRTRSRSAEDLNDVQLIFHKDELSLTKESMSRSHRKKHMKSMKKSTKSTLNYLKHKIKSATKTPPQVYKSLSKPGRTQADSSSSMHNHRNRFSSLNNNNNEDTSIIIDHSTHSINKPKYSNEMDIVLSPELIEIVEKLVQNEVTKQMSS